MSNFDTGIRPAITEYLRKKAEEQRDYGDYWSASSAGYCMRLTMMRRMKVPKVPELAEDQDRTTRVFEAGHIFHEWIQRITKDAGISVAQEVTLQDEDLMIRGHFDDLVLVDERLILYDYKTQNSQAFNYKRPNMSYYHKMQLGTYMYMLRNANPKEQYWPTDGGLPELKEARIMKISKDDLRMLEEQLFYTQELEDEVLKYWNTLNRYWREKKLPSCTCLDREGGFLGKRSAKGKIYNDFFYNEEPCSMVWFKKCLKEGIVKI